MAFQYRFRVIPVRFGRDSGTFPVFRRARNDHYDESNEL